MTFYSFSLYLKYFSFICIENSLCNPKETFTRLHDLGNSYEELYIKVKWCLYPHIPIFNKTKYTYVKLEKKTGKYLKIFKIAKHENCSCNQTVKSRAGNDQYGSMRKVFITTLNVIDTGNSVNWTTYNLIYLLYPYITIDSFTTCIYYYRKVTLCEEACLAIYYEYFAKHMQVRFFH